MKRLLSALALSAMMCTPAVVLAQSDKKPEPAKPAAPAKPTDKKPMDAAKPTDKAKMPEMDPKAMDEAWEKAAAVGPEHKELAKFEGEWNVEMTEMGMGGEAGTKMTGTSTNSMAMGGRFLETKYNGRYKGKFMTGLGMMGYNNIAKRYEHVWADSMGTMMMWMTGKTDAKGEITLEGKMSEPMSGGDMPMKQVLAWKDKDTYTITFYGKMGGQEMKMMEGVFTRSTGKKDDSKHDKPKKDDAKKDEPKKDDHDAPAKKK